MRIYISIVKLSIKVTLILSLAACKANLFSPGTPPSIDQSFLTGKPCDAPCWYGLEINRSTKDDVLSTLDSLPFIERSAYKTYETFWVDKAVAEEIQFTCQVNKESACGGALISNGVLKRLWLTTNYDLSLQDAIDKLGVPELLEYSWPTLSGKCIIEILWIERSISATIYDSKGYNECESIIDGNSVSPDIFVKTITYSSKEGFEVLGNCCQRIPWPGFKKK